MVAWDKWPPSSLCPSVYLKANWTLVMEPASYSLPPVAQQKSKGKQQATRIYLYLQFPSTDKGKKAMSEPQRADLNSEIKLKFKGKSKPKEIYDCHIGERAAQAEEWFVHSSSQPCKYSYLEVHYRLYTLQQSQHPSSNPRSSRVAPCTHHIPSRRLQQTHGGGHEFVSSKSSTRTSPALVFFLRERNTLVLALTERNIHQHRTGLSQRCRYSGARVAHPLGYQQHQVGLAQAPSHTAEELLEHCPSAPEVSAQKEEQPEHCSSPNTNVGTVSQTSSQLALLPSCIHVHTVIARQSTYIIRTMPILHEKQSHTACKELR